MFSSLNIYLKNSCIEFCVVQLIRLCHFNIVYRNTITSFLVLSIKICIHFNKTLDPAKMLDWTLNSLNQNQVHCFVLVFSQSIRFTFYSFSNWSGTFSLKLFSLRTQADERATTTAKNWICFSEKYDNTHFMIYFTCVQMFARRF